MKRLILRASVCAALLSAAVIGSSTTVGAQDNRPPTCGGLIVTIYGTSGNDNIIGTDGPDVISGLKGDDTIWGLGGDDVVCGGLGNDILIGGTGFDIMFGAQGDDYMYAANGSSVERRADTRGARMFGGQGNDTIVGSSRWDRMQGGAGHDVMWGFEGRDWMRGSNGSDSIDGGPGVDDLHGGNGHDNITIDGYDRVRGGAGLDLCTVSAGSPTRVISCGIGEREVPVVSPHYSFRVTRCPASGYSQHGIVFAASGTVTSSTGTHRSIRIIVDLFDAEGVKLGETSALVNNLMTGDTVHWRAEKQAEVSGVTTCVPRVYSEALPSVERRAGVEASISACGVVDGRLSATMSITNNSGTSFITPTNVFAYDADGIRFEHPMTTLIGYDDGFSYPAVTATGAIQPPGTAVTRCEVWHVRESYWYSPRPQ